MNPMNRVFPFTAIVGQDLMKQALILNAVNPMIGGVLIRGEKGTAKSTLARALADLLPEIPVVKGCPFNCDPAEPFSQCPFCATHQTREVLMRQMPVVTLPANATEDRVAGTIDIRHALTHGTRRFEPGVLAQAHRGILYIDEVNLLDNHIVDLLLDAAAMGMNCVEREGISFSHPSQFILIGTMNPEEGDLRPQLLDRFSLCVDAEALMDMESRAEIIRRRIAWEKDPDLFAASFEDHQRSLARTITAARALLPEVTVSSERIAEAAHLCISLDIRSHRADIVMVRTAITIAAFAGRREVVRNDIRQAARLCLPHRMRKRPFEESRLDPGKIDQALHDLRHDVQKDRKDRTEDPEPLAEQQERRFDIGHTPEFELPEGKTMQRQSSTAGRRTRTRADAPRGKYTRAVHPKGTCSGSDIAVDATLRAAALDQEGICRPDDKISIHADHLRVKSRTHPAGTTILFVVDASGSMGASRRMEAAKGAILNLLKDAYVNRSRVAMIAFRDSGAELILPPTDNVERAHEHLHLLPSGGRTPLAHGLARALELVQQLRQSDAAGRMFVVLLSDGKANVSYDPASQATPFEEAVAFARQIVLTDAALVVLDTEDDFLSLGMANQLARASGAEYIKLSRIEAEAVERTVRSRLSYKPGAEHDSYRNIPV